MSNKKKRGSADKFLYIAIGLMVVAFIVLIAIIVLFVNRGSGDTSEISSESSIESIEESSETSIEESKAPIVTGWIDEDGKRFYYDESGNRCIGVTEIDGSIYILSEDGMLSGGWVDFEDEKYYLNDDGTAHIGWLEQDGEKYYLQSDGTAATGEKEIDGAKYFFTSKGKNFIVANPWNYVPEGYEVDLVTLPSNLGSSSKGKVDSSCYDALMQMLNDCIDDGNSVYVISGHRTYEYQEGNFERSVRNYMNQGYSEEDARAKTATEIAVPGTSEHHLGLAVDIIDTADWSLTDNQENLAGQQWLMENCWKYGFILRYPKGKTDDTGIIYEPWHYRYVGTELAKELYDLDMTVEAYIESITD